MREAVVKILMTVFTICLAAFVIMGLVIVLTQVFAMIIGNGALSIGVSDLLLKPTVAVSAAAGISGWLYSYIAKKAT